MEFVRYSCEDGNLNGLHHCFIQPPQVAYFVTTCDKYGNMNTTDIGYGADWIGTYEQWLTDEVKHGHIDNAELQRAMELKALWKVNRDPVSNGAVRAELTALLRKAVGK